MHIAWSTIEEVPYCFSRSYVELQGHTAKIIVDFDPNWTFPDCNSSLNSLMDLKWCTKLDVVEYVPYFFSGSSIKFQRHTGWKIEDLNPIWVRLLGRSQLSNPSDLPCFVLFYLFKYSLISIHSIEKNSKITAVVVIPNTLWLNTPMFYHLWCRTNAALMRTSTNSPLFSINCKIWLIDVHPTWWEENILEVLHLVPFDLHFRHRQRHVRWHVNIFHAHIHQRPLYIMYTCQNFVLMDAMARNQLGDQICTN